VSNASGQYGGVLRRNTAGRFENIVITNARLAPVTLRDGSTFNNAAAGELVFDHSLLHGSFDDAAFPGTGASGDQAANTRNFLFTAMTRNRNLDPLLAMGAPSLLRTYMPDLMPRADSPALDAGFVAVPPDNGFLEAVDFQGAVGPGHDWILSGWATFSDN
jgi:hypothetical protein